MGCSKISVHDFFRIWINLMYVGLQFLKKLPDHDASVHTLPNMFVQYFSKLITVIDCTEIFTDYPRIYKARAQIYSNYKKHATLKFLIACAPLCLVSFIPKTWVVRVSNIDIVKGSDLPICTIMVTKALLILVSHIGLELIMASFMKGKTS